MDSNLIFKTAIASSTLAAGCYFANQLFGAQSEACDVVEQVFKCRYIRLSPKEVGFVIGKNGNAIHRLEEETGFHLRVVHKVPSTVRALEVKRLGGTNESDQCEEGAVPYLEVLKKVDETLQFLLELLEVTIRRLKENYVEETMLISRKHLGAIIGRRGCNVRTISSATSTKVTVEEQQNQNGVFAASDKCKIKISGPESHVAAAADMIEESIWRCIGVKGKQVASQRDSAKLERSLEEQVNQIRAIEEACEKMATDDANWE